MLTLNDREWKEFFITGINGLFSLKATKSGIDKNKLLDAKIKLIPYVTRSEKNNGIANYVGEFQKNKFKLDDGNVITIGLDTQTVYYQPHSFYTGQNIQILSSDKFNKYVSLFVCNTLRIQMKNFNWGGNGATLGRLARTKIMLPINEKGQPDYEFMEQYIREREEILLQKYKDFVTRNIKSGGGIARNRKDK